MGDLTQHFSLQDRIEELEEEVKMLRKKVKTERMLKSKYNVKYKKLYEKHNPPKLTRSDKAMILIDQKHKGEIDITLREIAKQCFVDYKHVCNLSCKYRKTLK